VELLLEDAATMLCEGHEPEKRPRRKPDEGDEPKPDPEWRDPMGPPPAAERKRKPQNALRVVTDG
jgi:hypothetical protein